MAVGKKRGTKIRIPVVDEQPLLREGAINLINRQIDMVVCGEADSIPSVQTASLTSSLCQRLSIELGG